MTTYLILPERKNSFRKYARSVERDCRERATGERRYTGGVERDWREGATGEGRYTGGVERDWRESYWRGEVYWRCRKRLERELLERGGILEM